MGRWVTAPSPSKACEGVYEIQNRSSGISIPAVGISRLREGILSASIAAARGKRWFSSTSSPSEGSESGASSEEITVSGEHHSRCVFATAVVEWDDIDDLPRLSKVRTDFSPKLHMYVVLFARGQHMPANQALLSIDTHN
eukprot:6153319-Pyramimonas_sp.AAC.1